MNAQLSLPPVPGAGNPATPCGRRPDRGGWRRWAWVSGLVWLLGAGCAENAQLRRTTAPPYRPVNYRLAPGGFPAEFRRVAVLPLTSNPQEPMAGDGVVTLETVFLGELRRRAVFEVVTVTKEELRAWTGQSTWRQEEPLPADFLSRIRQHTGCDGVLFAHLAVYRPYPPLAVGWRLRLVEHAQGRSLWETDEVFDAGSAEVIRAAQVYARQQQNQPATDLDSLAVLNSPRRFGQYTAAALCALLPGR